VAQVPEKQIETATANIHRYASGVSHLVIKPYSKVDVDSAEQWIEVLLELSEGQPLIMLIDNSHPHTTTMRARRYLSSAIEVKAAAGIAQNSMSAFLANLWIKTVPPVYPSKIFTNTDSAIKWLEAYL
jgi:hypothetical protein